MFYINLRFVLVLTILASFLRPHALTAQCTMYTIDVVLDGACPQASEITWILVGSDGTLWYSGGAPFTQVVCLPEDCYTLQMLDTGGDGWECVDWIIEDFIGDFAWDTNLEFGTYGIDQFGTGNADCGVISAGCPPGTSEFNLQLDNGDNPSEISWTLSLGGVVVQSGFSDANIDLCLGNGCFTFEMFDSGGNGWEDAFYQFDDEFGSQLYSGTLISGAYDFAVFNVGNLDCTNVDPGGGGGGGGGGCGTAVPGSDCSAAACVCDPYSFSISPSGFGTFNEVPSPGSTSNPNYGGSPPWGGTDSGCLLAGELNSSWLFFTAATSGTLQFSFGQNSNGGQIGFYDWAMWPYNGVSTCGEISGNSLPPVRCVWNATTSGGTGLANPIPSGGNAGNYGPPLNVFAGEQFIICFSNWSYATGNVVLDFFGSASIECSMILPVNFVEVRANQQLDNVVVSWITAGEINNDFFIVQHSLDGYHWTDIAEVDGHGTSALTWNYSFLHIHPAPGLHYYRIRQIDFNGMSKISPMVDIWINEQSFAIYPNPTFGRLFIEGFFHKEISIELLDASGRLVDKRNLAQTALHEIELSSFQTGIYMLIITCDNKRVWSRIVLDGVE